MADRAVKFVISVLRTQPTMATLPQPWIWFKPQPHVTDSKASKTMSMVRGGNALLALPITLFGQMGDCFIYLFIYEFTV